MADGRRLSNLTLLPAISRPAYQEVSMCTFSAHFHLLGPAVINAKPHLFAGIRNVS
jgi:hypothetical protein